MLFTGRIIKEQKMFDHKIILISDYARKDCYTMYAVIEGKFDKDFCDGVDPASITENGNSFVEASIQVSHLLLDRLRRDGQTSQKNLDLLEELLSGEREIEL